MRSFLLLTVAGSLGLLAGCGGGSTPAGLPITIALQPGAPQTINQAQTLNIAATVSNDTSNKGVSWTLTGAGSLGVPSATGVVYNAPKTVTGNSLATVTATSVATPTVTASVEITTMPSGAGPNVAAINVDGGPVSGAIYPNGVFTSVQLCVPGTSTCQTIDGILVDTGSFGLRLLASQITIPLPVLADSSGNTLNNCIQFLDNSFLWGNVAAADIAVGGEVASGTSIQAIANPTGYSIPGGCIGTNEDTQQLLGANGILGVGPEPFDCGTACDPSSSGSPPPIYYLCSSAGCQPVFVSCGVLCGDSSPNQQLINLAFGFPVDNNGVILELPAVPDTAPTVGGKMIFGIGTETNNPLGSASVFTMDAGDNFTTMYKGQTLTGSFIDSGSNGLFFPDSTLAICPNDSSWYCPASTTALSATQIGLNTTTKTINFNVDNFETVVAAHPSDAAFSNIAGPNTSGFDWGLPFFYGRNVFTAIDAVPPPPGVPAGPFWAY